MKIIQIFLLCVFMISATNSFAEINQNTLFKNLEVAQTQNYFPNIFLPITSFVKKILGKKHKPIVCYFGLDINITFSKNEVNCSADASIKVVSSYLYNEKIQQINLKHLVYEVSGGKIIGSGEEAIWDLSNVSEGIYTLNAIDGDCGLCGKSSTKTIKVIDCPK